MKTAQSLEARKRPVNLTLSENLVVQVRSLTDRLSGVVDSLLADYVEHERRQRMARVSALEATIATWNDFNLKHGSFADEYSSL